jgi:cysteine synthase B
VAPDPFPGIEGLKPLGERGDIVPAILDAGLIDERIPVRLEQGVELCGWLARQGLYVGPSSGAFLHAALAVARRGRYRAVVTVFNDTGERYGSTEMWAEATRAEAAGR